MGEVHKRVCPVCQLSDKVQKVTAVVSESSVLLNTRLSMPALPQEPKFSPGNFPYPSYARWTTSAALVDMPPIMKNARRVAIRASKTIIWSIILLLGTCGALLFTLSYNIKISPVIFLVIMSCLVVAGLVAAIITGINFRALQLWGKPRYKEIKTIFLEAEKRRKIEFTNIVLRDYELLKQQIKKMQDKWQTELYYCHRDDVVFIGSKFAPPEKMSDVLLS